MALDPTVLQTALEAELIAGLPVALREALVAIYERLDVEPAEDVEPQPYPELVRALAKAIASTVASTVVAHCRDQAEVVVPALTVRNGAGIEIGSTDPNTGSIR